MTWYAPAPVWPALLLVSLVPTATASAQSGHRIVLQAGAVSTAGRDELASPLRYAGTGLLATIGYGFDGDQRDFESGASLSLRSLSNTEQADGPSLDETSAGATLRYLEHVWHMGAIVLSAGAFTGFHAALRDYSHGGTYWEGYLAAGPAVGARVESARDRVQLSFSSPLLAWAMRPPYSIDSDALYRAYYENTRFVTALGRVASARSLRSVRVQATYARYLMPWIRASLTYRLVHLRYEEPRPTVSAATSLQAGLWIVL